uniref:Sodium/potassium-transporting ATPase subunit alpha n=1 Tax=Acrobeloides nanus TaxID=290746 RepID=A0A914CA35_9BILA
MSEKKKKREENLDELKKEITITEHEVPIEELYKSLDTNPEKGLDEQEASRRLVEYGPNQLTPPKNKPLWFKFIISLFEGFNILMWIGSVACFINFIIVAKRTAETVDYDTMWLGIILAAVVLITSIFTFYQERKSQHVMESFKKMIPPKVTVVRSQKMQQIDAVDLVIGDIVYLVFGDKVPADVRVIEANGFKVDNSSLTGENVAVRRTPEFTHKNPLETSNLVFFGTSVVEGNALGIVILTGDNTVMGRIAGLTSLVETNQTPIAKEIKHFIKMIGTVAISLGLLFLAISLYTKYKSGTLGEEWIDCIVFFIGIIVANVPEGILPTITVCLTLTAKRMSKKNCLVKNLEAVETLGSTSTICSDKTGTLTQNRMTVAHLWVNGKIFDSEVISEQPRNDSTERLLRCAALCSRAKFKNEDWNTPDSKRETIGDASEVAIMKFVNKQLQPVNVHELRERCRKINEIPFNSNEKYSVTIHRKENGQFLLLMKGAPERILHRCSTISIDGQTARINELVKDGYNVAYEYLGGRGERVLGFCEMELDPVKFPPNFKFDTDEPNFPLENLCFLGLISMIDPPRPGVPEAVRLCQSAGIQVVMVTGDHPITAKAIARQVNIIGQPKVVHLISLETDELNLKQNEIKAIVVHGEWLNKLEESELDFIVHHYDQVVFARTSPAQKLKIVEAYQRAGRIVAVTGDGVNDAPALRKADIGIAMGITGTEVSKQAADMVLLDDNFASIVTGVEEGRLIFDNLKKSIAYTLTSNIPELAPFLTYITLGIPLPMSIRAILCIDLGTDILPAISFAYEPAESDIMDRPPRNPKRDRLVNWRLLFYSYLLIGVFQAIVGFSLYFWIMAEHGFPSYTLLNLKDVWEKRDLLVPDKYNRYWNYQDRMNLLGVCHGAFFYAIVCVQWADLLISKTRMNSIVTQGLENNVLNISLLFTTLLSTFFLFTPGVNSILKVGPIKLRWAMLPVLGMWQVFAFDEIRRAVIRKYPDGVVFHTTYY